jgi:hypothetical protein
MPKGRRRLVNDREITSMLEDDDDDGIGPMQDLFERCLESDSDTDPGEEIVEVSVFSLFIGILCLICLFFNVETLFKQLT